MIRTLVSLLCLIAFSVALTDLIHDQARSANGQDLWSVKPGAKPAGLPNLPNWGRGGPHMRPSASNPIFATADGCALCHSASANASAMRTTTGDDVSPHALWQGSMMANAARDPYWRAQLAAESASEPHRAEEFEQLCMRCHTPMAHQTHRIAGWDPLRVEEATQHPLYADGVSCTVCHQIQPDNLGTESSFNGNPIIKPGRVIFGPFADPAIAPMQMHAAMTPTHSEHIRSSALCASCHTLETAHGGGDTLFPEQTPYYEWRNSAFSTETGTPGPMAAGCIDCHMPELGPMRIARNPRGLDFAIQTRDGTRGHTFVGANAFMLDMLRDNAQELGVTAPAAAFDRNAIATRALLSHRTATVEIGDPQRKEIDGQDILEFEVTVNNLTGHKLPSAYPSRRVWIEAYVRDGNRTIFDSGAFDDRGRLVGVADEFAIPHYNVITAQEQVAVYEMVSADSSGVTTTLLTRMATRSKDNRLLPIGWRPDGPHAETTAPVGTEHDRDFRDGSDTVTYRVPLPEGTSESCTITVWLWLQTIPPAWAEALREYETPETERFLRMYDNADPTPEQLAVSIRIE